MTSAAKCTQCGVNGTRVKPITLQSLLNPDAVKRISDTQYRFCDNADCDNVYYGENGEAFGKGDLRVRVGVKETDVPRTVCYCFHHTIEGINAEVHCTGKSTVLDDIKDQMKTECWCETKNPRGGCCLGTVRKYVKLAIAEHGADCEVDKYCEAQPDCCSKGPADVFVNIESQRSGLLAATGSIVSAIAASACCWLPLLLLAFGVSAGGVAGLFEDARQYFLIMAVAFLIAGFYFAYFHKPTRLPGQSCSVPNPKRQRFNRATLWAATVFVTTFALFPYYSLAIVRAWTRSTTDSLTQGTSQVPSDLVSQSYSIDGMTCESCAATLELEFANLPDVVEASVSYEQSSVTLRSRYGEVDHETVRNVVEHAGFRLANKNMKRHE